MRQSVKQIGAGIGVGGAALLGTAKQIIDIISLPQEAQDALKVIASASPLFFWLLLAVGLFCAGYLIYDDAAKIAAGWRKAVRNFRVQFLIPIGAGLAAAGIALIIVGWLFSGNRSATNAKVIPSTAALSSPLPDISWDYDKPNWGMIGFLNLARSASQDQTVWVRAFQALGQNNTDGPILHLSGIIRSDLNNREVPVNFRVGPEIVRPEDTYGIPRNASFNLESGPFNTADTRGLTREEFLATFGAFTFELNYDGKRYIRHFTRDDSERLILKFVTDLDRGSPKPPPMVTKKTTGNR